MTMNKAPWPYRTIVTANSAFIKSIVCLGQREGDIIIMPRSAYDPIDGSIVISQHKTGQRVAVPVLPELKREIDITPKIGTILVVSEKSGRPYKEHHFRHVHRKICRAAGTPDKRKFMDLRHTAATRLGEAGCADDIIRAVTGHKDRTVVARYVRLTGTMARAAINKLLDQRRPKTER
ncbi:MAG: tyrosine-type recombinase/integrase [Alphaproteobacteria bacterium]|nr:tyrosine-type recombinase/integrase [Alphaproteobacteria bacterium]